MQSASSRGLIPLISKRKWPVKPAFGLVAAVALSGCASDAPDRSLTFPMPGAFSASSPRAGEPMLEGWWRRFRSPGLNTLIADADSGNFDIVIASSRLMQADAQARVAGSALFPLVNLSGDAQESQSSGTSGRRVITQPNFRRSFGGALSVSYILDIWGKLQDARRAAELQADSAAYTREAVRVATQASVATAYVQHAAARERLKVAQDNLGNSERILKVIRERLAAGTGNALDVAQQEALVAGQRAGLPQLRETAANTRTTLALLVGRPPQGFSVQVPGLFALRTPGVSPGLPSALLLRRPDIRAAEFELASAEANVDVARKAMLPQIDLTGQGGVQSARLVNLFRPESAIYSVAAGLAQTVFDGGKLGGQLDASIARRQELLDTYRKAIVSAFVDVETALTAVREGAAREQARRVAVDKARVAFRLAEERLRQGAVDLVTVLNTQQTLFQTQDQLTQDRLLRLQAAINLFQALGGDWSQSRVEARQRPSAVGWSKPMTGARE